MSKKTKNIDKIRRHGQVWTPSWVADAMVSYIMSNSPESILDPAVGEGVFLLSARRVSSSVRLIGYEIDESVLFVARGNGLVDNDLTSIKTVDFLADIDQLTPEMMVDAVVANPPYIRHHMIEKTVKDRLLRYSEKVIGTRLDGRSGLHLYFLIRALQMLKSGGRLAFILPSDVFDGVSSPTLWKWIANNFKIDAVITFSSEATPFSGVDTNAVVVLIQNDKPSRQFVWARCMESESTALFDFVSSGFSETNGIYSEVRSIDEALATGISRKRRTNTETCRLLSEFADVIRGIATGDNDFFFLSRDEVSRLEIDEVFFKRAIGRTRDLPESSCEITIDDIEAIDLSGRPTYLLSIESSDSVNASPAVLNYIRHGEDLGLPQKPLLSSRRPWYRMEKRLPPDFLFAYLGRKNIRFIKNTAKVVPLSCFLCVYAKSGVNKDVLFSALSDQRTIENLAYVGKSYGNNSIKVEPKSLLRLEIPEDLLANIYSKD